MSDDIPTSMAEAMAEIRRLRADVLRLLRRSIHQSDRDAAAAMAGGIDEALADLDARDDELRRLRVRILEYEARAAVSMGTLEQPTPDEPPTYTHNVPPSAPPHIGHTIKWPTRTGDDHE